MVTGAQTVHFQSFKPDVGLEKSKEGANERVLLWIPQETATNTLQAIIRTLSSWGEVPTNRFLNEGHEHQKMLVNIYNMM
jgi:hypothetical protein